MSDSPAWPLPPCTLPGYCHRVLCLATATMYSVCHHEFSCFRFVLLHLYALDSTNTQPNSHLSVALGHAAHSACSLHLSDGMAAPAAATLAPQLASCADTVKIWDLPRNTQAVHAFRPHTGPIHCVRWNHNNQVRGRSAWMRPAKASHKPSLSRVTSVLSQGAVGARPGCCWGSARVLLGLSFGLSQGIYWGSASLLSGSGVRLKPGW